MTQHAASQSQTAIGMEDLHQLDLATIRMDMQNVQKLKKLFSQDSVNADSSNSRPARPITAGSHAGGSSQAKQAETPSNGAVKSSSNANLQSTTPQSSARVGHSAHTPPTVAPRPTLTQTPANAAPEDPSKSTIRRSNSKLAASVRGAPPEEDAASQMPKSLANIFNATASTVPKSSASAAGSKQNLTTGIETTKSNDVRGIRPHAPVVPRQLGTVNSMPNQTTTNISLLQHVGQPAEVVPGGRFIGRAQSMSVDSGNGSSTMNSNVLVPPSLLMSPMSTQRSRTSNDSSIDIEDDTALAVSKLRLDASVSKRSIVSNNSASSQSSDHIIDMTMIESSSTNSAPVATTYVRNPNAQVQRKKTPAVNSAVSNVQSHFSKFVRKFVKEAGAEEEEKQAKLRNITITNLPMKFIAKYLGMRLCQNEADPTNVPVEVLVEEAAKLQAGQDLSLVILNVTEEGLEMTEHPGNTGPRLQNSTYFPITYISFAVQDLLYERVVSIIFITELSARLPKTECHSFVCSNAFAARALALSLQLGFKKLVDRLQGEKVTLSLDLTERQSLSGKSRSTVTYTNDTEA